MRRSSKALIILGALFIWYTLIGFIIAPALIRHFGEAQLRENFSPESSITKVRINPFTGSFRIEGLKLTDAAGAWSVDWQEAELNISAASLIKFYPVIDAARLIGMDLRYELRPGSAPAEKESAAEGSGDWRDIVDQLNLAEIPKVRVDLLEVSAGRVEFVDQTPAEIYRKTVDPINFTLRDFTTVVADETAMHFTAQTDDGATLSWEGDLLSQPIRSSGRFSLSGLGVHDLSPYYTEFIRFNLKRAVFGLDFNYQLDLSDMEDLFQILNGHLALTEVLCVPIDQDDRLISVDSVSVTGIGFRFPAMEMEVSEVEIATGETRIFRDADGQINLAQLVALPEPSEKPATEVPAREDSLPGMSYLISQITLTDYRIIWEEVLNDGLANLTVEIPKMAISEFSSDLESPFQLTADYRIGQSGTAQIKGSVVPATPSLDLSMQIKQVPLNLLSPYAQNFGKAEIDKGTFDFDGRFQYAATGQQVLSGDAAITGFALLYDSDLQAEWSALDLTGLQIDLSPFSLSLESMKLEQPEIVFTQTAEAVEGQAAEATEGQAAANADQGPPEASENRGSEAAPIQIDSLTVANGRLVFIDETIESSPEIVMDAFNLDFSGLDLAGGKPAEISLGTQINGSAFQLEGTIDVGQFKEATRLKASLSGLSLPAFSAYSGQAVGRRISDGSFTLDSDWEIVASQLKASNKIRIEKLKFGETVESEGATSLPLDLAVTLLQGPNGVMDLSLPLSGDLSDPKVGIGQIVRTAVFGLITNVAAAPFKLLSGLVDGEEDLSVVGFNPGSAQLEPTMISRLNSLASALKERPGLKLEITPQISRADEDWIAEEKLKVDLLGDDNLSDEVLYQRRLTRRYREAMEAADTPDRQTTAEDEVGLEKMLATILPEIELTDADRAALASERASAIREHLMTAQGIDGGRLSVSEPEIGVNEASARFDLE